MNKKIKIGIGAAAIVLVGAILINGAKAGGSTGTPIETTTAITRDLTASISATGMVESQNSRGVYSALAYPVNAINVKVGDKVTEGDTLAQLDTTDISLQIAQQRASIGATASVTGQQVNAASQNLANAQFTNDSGLNAQIISSQANVDSAEYAVQSARNDLRTAERARSDYSKTTTGTGGYTGGTTGNGGVIGSTGQTLVEGLSGSTGGAIITEGGGLPSTNSSSTQDQLDDTVAKARIAVNSAENTLANAKKALQATLNSANIEMDTYEQQLAAARANNNTSAQQIQLQTLQKSFDDATVKAPVSGTVTAVYAEAGANGSGLLFMVEDIELLKIETTVKEFNVLSVEPGKKVIIQSDATGDDKYEGTVASVSPTAVKASNAATGTAANAAAKGSSTSEFAVTVHVTSPSTRLKVGMNTRLEIITDEKTNVQSLPTDVIFTTADGKDAVYVAQKTEDGKWVAKETLITPGLETDYYIEIASPKFANTDIIIGKPDGISDGDVVVISEDASAGNATSSTEKVNIVSAEEATSEEVASVPDEEASPAVESEAAPEQVTVTSAAGESE